MEAIDVLVRINRAQDFFSIDVFGQRELNQYAVDIGAAVQFGDQ